MSTASEAVTPETVTPETVAPETVAREPARSRAVFSTADFKLLRDAVKHYMQQTEIKDSADFARFSTLYHRLGRVS